MRGLDVYTSREQRPIVAVGFFGAEGIFSVLAQAADVGQAAYKQHEADQQAQNAASDAARQQTVAVAAARSARQLADLKMIGAKLSGDPKQLADAQAAEQRATALEVAAGLRSGDSQKAKSATSWRDHPILVSAGVVGAVVGVLALVARRRLAK